MAVHSPSSNLDGAEFSVIITMKGIQETAGDISSVDHKCLVNNG